MRKEYNIQKEQSEWQIIADIPFISNTNDISGNNNNASVISGTPQYVDYNNEKYCDSRNSVIRLLNPDQLSYVNNFKLEIDFVWFSGGSNYFALVDGNDKASTYKGIMIGSSYGSLFAFGIRFANQRELDGVYGYTPPKSSILYDTKYHCIITNYNGTCSVKLEDENGNIQEGTATTPLFTQVSYSYIQIGTDVRYTTTRAFNGYFKNFKLYRHI